MDFWKSGTVRKMVTLVVGGVILLLQFFGVEVNEDVEKIVDGVIALGVIAIPIWQIIRRIRKPAEQPIRRDTIPVPIRKLAGKVPSRGPSVVLLSILLIGATACGSTFSSRTNKALLGFEAAYKIEEPVRAAFCRGKVPQPPACVTAFNVAKKAYATYRATSSAFALYLDLQADQAKAEVIRLLPELLKLTTDLTTAATELK